MVAMKNLFKLPISMLYLLVLVSCSSDPPNEPQAVTPGPNVPENPRPNFPENPRPNVPDYPNDDTGGNDPATVNFGFLNGSTNTYIDMPIESSPIHLFIGRWKITKFGGDYSDGNMKFYNYQDYNHKDCGESFLQFNNDGVVFENNYYKHNNACTLYSNTVKWELIEANRFKIDNIDFIFLVEVNETELILKYDWNYTDWAPMQTYYHYERILPPD